MIGMISSRYFIYPLVEMVGMEFAVVTPSPHDLNWFKDGCDIWISVKNSLPSKRVRVRLSLQSLSNKRQCNWEVWHLYLR